MKIDDAGLDAKAGELEFGDAEILRRKAFLEFGEPDALHLRRVHATLNQHAEDFIRGFYAHLYAFEETRRLLPEAEGLLQLQRTQSAYFQGLTAGDYGRDYFEHRLRVGFVHQRVGLAPEWYLGAYAKYLSGLLPTISGHFGDDRDGFIATMRAFIKVVLLDMGLAIDAYIQARDKTILGLKNYAELVFDSMHDGILVLSPELRIESCNRRFLDLLGEDSAVPLNRPLAKCAGRRPGRRDSCPPPRRDGGARPDLLAAARAPPDPEPRPHHAQAGVPRRPGRPGTDGDRGDQP